MAHPKSQSWLLQFCVNLRTQPFYRAVGGLQLTNCFMETFVKWMGFACVNGLEQNRWPCCNSFEFPYPRNVFHFCIVKAMYVVYNTPSTIFVPSVAGPKFSNPLFHSSNQTLMPIIKAVVVEFESNFVFTTSYVDMENFYKQVYIIHFFTQLYSTLMQTCIIYFLFCNLFFRSSRGRPK